MRISSAASEAWRNIVSGAARTLSLTLALAIPTCLVIEFETATTSDLIAKTDAFIAAGGSTYILSSSANIDSAACENLITTGSFEAAGALRIKPDTMITALINNPVPTYEASNGWWHLAAPDTTGNLLAGDALAQVIAPGLLVGKSKTVDDIQLSGAFPWPEDSRTSNLGFSLVARANNGTFDECWIRMSDPTATPGGLIRTALVTEPVNPEDTKLRQLNSSLGILSTFDDYQSRPSRAAWMMAVAWAALLAAIAMRLRALAWTTARSYGAPNISLYLQALFEVMSWVLPAVIIGFGFLLVRVASLSSAHFWEVIPVASAIPCAVLCSALLAAPITLKLLLRSSVDHFLRRRTG